MSINARLVIGVKGESVVGVLGRNTADSQVFPVHCNGLIVYNFAAIWERTNYGIEMEETERNLCGGNAAW